MESKKKFNNRAFFTIGMMVSGVLLPFSGLMNHLLGFEMLTLNRHLWMTVHNVLGVIFVIFVVCHIVINGRVIKNYLLKIKQMSFSSEALAAISAVGICSAVAVLHVFITAQR